MPHVGRTDLGEGRRADGDEDGLQAFRRLEARHKRQTAGSLIGENQLCETRLVDRDPARLQFLDFPFVNLHADDFMAEIREAGAGDKSNIARPDHRNPH